MVSLTEPTIAHEQSEAEAKALGLRASSIANLMRPPNGPLGGWQAGWRGKVCLSSFGFLLAWCFGIPRALLLCCVLLSSGKLAPRLRDWSRPERCLASLDFNADTMLSISKAPAGSLWYLRIPRDAGHDRESGHIFLLWAARANPNSQ